MRGAVSFVGAGPGAADLITLRGAARIAEADLVLYTPSAVDPLWLREHTKPDADLVDHARLAADELAELYRRLASRHHRAVRLVAGDPAHCPDLREQRELCARLGLDTEVVAGVSPVSAAAAATGNALVETAGADTVVVTEADFERVREVAADSRTLVVHAPAARAAELVEALLGAGLDPEVPVVVAHKVSWVDETLLRTTIGELVADVKGANLWRNAVFLVGDALRQAKPRAGYAPREAETGKRWTSRSWRSNGSWSRRSFPEPAPTFGDPTLGDPTVADAVEPESAEPGTAAPEHAEFVSVEPVVAQPEPTPVEQAGAPAVESVPEVPVAAEPKPVVKRATATKKQPARPTRTGARRTTKK
ncbi:SAM-dependent methyltransferase [Actinokineospora cianjurensis]|uniref:Precorrin-4/cobalt-precorrin-4 C11-methyltransferase n=1 Tax=Actinokineospora cianjurensis TaxID=585224 RepID=A0A421B0D0_9PSEU|nr:SAM-dependent methyltransferase [Actinokineospora cianjurensis]RLK55573.1 precorrin-4/cobalt-precorrin-4 C11-methyltransferase [Actinokineospora cianjurensis]